VAHVGIPEVLMVLASFVFWFMLIAGARAAMASRGMNLPFFGRPLVLQKFFLDSTGRAPSLVEIQGRPQGFIPWLLTAMSIDTTTNLTVTRNEISLKQAKLSGEWAIVVPLSQVARLYYGFTKPIILIVIGVVVAIASIAAGLTTDNSWLMLAGLFLAAIFLIAYFLSKRMAISVETTGGSSFGISFKRGVLDGVAIDLAQTRSAVDFINWAIQTQARKGA